MVKHTVRILLTLLSVVVVMSAGVAKAEEFDWKRHAGSEITLLIAENPVTNGIRALAPQFESETGIKLNIQALAEDLYFDRMELALRASEGSADVYFQPMDSTGYTQYTAGLLRPVTPYLNDPAMTAQDFDLNDFPPGFLNAISYPPDANEKLLYGIPISFETYILFYNKDLVDEYLGGVLPKTMSELVAAAKLISEKSGGKVVGSVMRGMRSDTLIDTVTGMVFNAWGSASAPYPYNIWFDGDWSKPQLTNPAIVRGLTHYADLMKSGPINVQSMDWPEATTLFKQGRVAFYIDASLFGPSFENSKDSKVVGRVGYSPIPPDNDEGKSYTAHWMWGLGIPANSKNPDAAWYFIQWMTNKQNDPKIGTFSGGAPRLSTWSKDEYTSTLNPEYVSAVREAMKTSRSSIVFRPGWSEFALRIIDTIHAIYEQTDPETAALAAQEDFTKMLAK